MTFTGCPAHLRRRTLFEKNGACLPVLFHVLEPPVHNLFDAKEFGAEDVAGIVDLTAQVRAQIIDPPIGIAQPTIIHEDANEHRQGGYADRQERLSGAGHELIVARGPSAHPTDPPPTSGKPSSPYSHKDRSTLSALAARSESRLPDSARPAARNPPAQSDRAHAERPPGSPIPPPAAGTKRPPRYLSRSPPAHCARPPRGIHGHILPDPQEGGDPGVAIVRSRPLHVLAGGKRALLKQHHGQRQGNKQGHPPPYAGLDCVLPNQDQRMAVDGP